MCDGEGIRRMRGTRVQSAVDFAGAGGTPGMQTVVVGGRMGWVFMFVIILYLPLSCL